jgi:D-3-phosphoglycerate dehydrogenase / 2-oxoglutarate reductase
VNLRVLISCPHLQRRFGLYEDLFAGHRIETELPQVVQQLDEAWLLAEVDRFDGMVAGDDPLTARVLERARRLKVISKWGVGVDNIDLAAAAARGIPVTNTPGAFASELADLAVGYVLMLARHLREIDQGVREGRWEQIQGASLAGKTLGIVGLGHSGCALARRAEALELDVLGYDVDAPARTRSEALGVRHVELDELLRRSDFISLHCALTAANRHLIGREALAKTKPGVFLVNTSRGALVDEEALADALYSGHVAGAALDVFEHEPLPPESRLRRSGRCIFGAHNGSNTAEAVERVNRLAVENLLRGLGVQG